MAEELRHHWPGNDRPFEMSGTAAGVQHSIGSTGGRAPGGARRRRRTGAARSPAAPAARASRPSPSTRRPPSAAATPQLGVRIQYHVALHAVRTTRTTLSMPVKTRHASKQRHALVCLRTWISSMTATSTWRPRSAISMVHARCPAPGTSCRSCPAAQGNTNVLRSRTSTRQQVAQFTSRFVGSTAAGHRRAPSTSKRKRVVAAVQRRTGDEAAEGAARVAGVGDLHGQQPQRRAVQPLPRPPHSLRTPPRTPFSAGTVAQGAPPGSLHAVLCVPGQHSS